MLASVVIAVAAAAALTPETAVTEALSGGPDAILARLAAELPVSDVTSARSVIYPQVSLSASASRQFIGDRTIDSAFPVFTKDANGNPQLSFQQQQQHVSGTSIPDWSIGAQASQLVYDGGRWWKNLDAAKAALAAAGGQRDEALLDVALAAWTRFFEVVRAERSLSTLDAALARDQEQLDASSRLFEGGKALKTDVFLAAANLAQDRVSRAGQQRVVDQARTDLAAVLGRAPDATLAAAAPADLLADVAAPEGADADHALRQRPRLRQFADQRVAAGQLADVARAAYQPVVSLFANYNRQGPGFTDVYGDPRRQYTAGVGAQVNYNLFSGFAVDAAAQKAAVQVRQAKELEAQAQLAVQVDVAHAQAALTSANAALAAAADGDKAAHDALSLAQAAYEIGTGNILTVRDANLKVAQAELSRVSAAVDAREALGSLWRALGSLPTGRTLESK